MENRDARTVRLIKWNFPCARTLKLITTAALKGIVILQGFGGSFIDAFGSRDIMKTCLIAAEIVEA